MVDGRFDPGGGGRGAGPAAHPPGALVHGLVGRARRRCCRCCSGCRRRTSCTGSTFPCRDVIRALLLVPFVLPTVVVGVAFRQLLGEAGPLGFLGLDGTPVAIIAGLVFFNVAVVIRAVGADLGVARRRGRPRPRPRWARRRARCSAPSPCPALRPALVSAASVVFLFCATSFGVVLTLGGLRYSSVETEIYLLTTQLLDLQAAAALSIVQLLAVHRAARR